MDRCGRFAADDSQVRQAPWHGPAPELGSGLPGRRLASYLIACCDRIVRGKATFYQCSAGGRRRATEWSSGEKRPPSPSTRNTGNTSSPAAAAPAQSQQTQRGSYARRRGHLQRIAGAQLAAKAPEAAQCRCPTPPVSANSQSAFARDRRLARPHRKHGCRGRQSRCHQHASGRPHGVHPRRAAGSGQATATAPGIQVLFLCMPRSPLSGQQKVFARCGMVAGGQLDYPA